MFELEEKIVEIRQLMKEKYVAADKALKEENNIYMSSVLNTEANMLRHVLAILQS